MSARILGFLLLATAAAWPGLTSALPASFGADADYKALSCGGGPAADGLQDASAAKDERDIVGDATHPGLLYRTDGTHVFFRLRLDGTPLTTATGVAPLNQFGWGIGIDTDKTPQSIEYYVIVNGITEQVALIRVQDGVTLKAWQPTLTGATPPFEAGWVHVKQAASSFGGNPDFFVTFAVPMAEASLATAQDPHPLQWSSLALWAATSTGGLKLDKDFLCWNDGAGAVILDQADSGPIQLVPANCADGVQNGGESGVDCGGGCATKCGAGLGCKTSADCASGLCDAKALVCIEDCLKAVDPAGCEKDPDGDGLPDTVEDPNGNGEVDPGETDPSQGDSDGDGLPDGVEDANGNGDVDPSETDPRTADTDGDGLPDGIEDANGNGGVDVGETDPRNPDTDGDGMADGAEDSNLDGDLDLDLGETDPTVADHQVALYGGGCSTGAEPAGHDAAVALLGAFAVLLVLWRRARLSGVVVLLLAVAWPQGAVAQAGDVSVLRFQPPASGLGLLHGESGRTLGHLVSSVGLVLHGDHKALQVRDTTSDQVLYDELETQVVGQLVAAIGLWRRFEIGFGLPVALHQAGEARPAQLGQGAALGAGLGDLRVVPKAMVLASGPLSVAAAVAITLPTSTGTAWLGDDGVGAAPVLAASWDTDRYGVTASAGVHLRPEQSFSLQGSKQQVTIDDEATATLGGRFAVLPGRLDLLADARTTLALAEQDAEERSGEVLLGARLRLPADLVATAAAGPGIGRGVGTPQARVVMGFAWAPEPERDTDRDGIADLADRCPKDAEDRDGFEDADGCPDLDDDRDGIADAKDDCRLQPEDKDGFADADGCPDPDNDQDGVLDLADKCPLQAEDVDGHEDADGCPDPDNDKDLVLDVDDKCPNLAGLPADDGCPPRDGDGDGIADRADKCPDKPETFNGIEDDDGCPDKEALVIVTATEIKILQTVYFATGRAQIKAVSYDLLNAVAAVIKAHKEIGRIRVEGHTDDVGGDARNLKLSQARSESVRRYLVQAGVPVERLEAQGFGELWPRCTDLTGLLQHARSRKQAIAGCRELNRRVQFRIVEANGRVVGEAVPPQAPQLPWLKAPTRKPQGKQARR